MRRLLAIVLLLCLSPSASAQNFTGADDYVEAAEAARRDLAIFWTGDVLPRWSSTCQIHAKTDPQLGAGGATTFAFDRGQVFGWNMTVQGSRDRIIDAVIPHEVMHTVTASTVRRPVPRWLDEGIATLFEDRSEHIRQRQTALHYANHSGCAWNRLDSFEYPTKAQWTGRAWQQNGQQDMEAVMALYSTGFTIVEWLIEGWGHERLWRFLKDERLPSQKFPDWYRMSVRDGEASWLAWLSGRDVNAPHVLMARMSSYQPSATQSPERKTLYVVTTSAFFCLPCLNWKTAYSTDGGFREQLHRMVNVQQVTLEQNRELATRLGVAGVPAFCIDGRKLEGFYGKQHLLSWVAETADCARPQGAPAAEPPPSAPAAEPPAPQIVKGEKGDKGDKGDPGRDGKDADPSRVAALEATIAELTKRLKHLEDQTITLEIRAAGEVVGESVSGPLGKDGRRMVGFDVETLTQPNR